MKTNKYDFYVKKVFCEVEKIPYYEEHKFLFSHIEIVELDKEHYCYVNGLFKTKEVYLCCNIFVNKRVKVKHNYTSHFSDLDIINDLYTKHYDLVKHYK